MADVFISHSSEDASVAGVICEQLEAANVDCWIAPRDPLPGMPYAGQLVEAIDNSRIVLLLLSAASNASPAVLSEIELAWNRRKIIVPCRIDDVTPSKDLEFYLRAVHWFSAADGRLERRGHELVELVQRILEHGLAPERRDPGCAPLTNNLSPAVTSFVGRSAELADICRLCETSRLVTTVGAGGVGKTRTALRIGEIMLEDEPDLPVWFVDFAPLTDASLLVSTVASAVGVGLPAVGDALPALTAALHGRRLMLILDNCEHLVNEVASLASALLQRCARVSIVATSRQALGVPGERLYRMPSLAPDEAVALFEERARAVNSEFSASGAHAQTVGNICERLDGIALAIELAAARMNVLTPAQLCTELEHRFRVLTRRGTQTLPRHQTLEATIDWSHGLLDEREQLLFRRASVFVAGFTMDAATAVCVGDGLEAYDVFDVLASLVDKSLLVADLTGDTARFRFLESTRAYAREKLKRAGESESVASRHLEYMCALLTRAGAEYEATMSTAVLSALAVELDDVRRALEWAVACGDVPTAVDLFLTTRLWDHLGLHHEAIQRAERYIAMLGDNDPLRRARLWDRIALLALRTGHTVLGSSAAAKAVADARLSGDAEVLAEALARHGSACTYARRFDEAKAALDEAEAVAPPTPRRSIQLSLTRGLRAHRLGDLASAARCFAQNRELFRALGNDVGIVTSSLNLAEMEYARGEIGLAVAAARDALPQARNLPDGSIAAQLLRNLCGYLAAANDLDAAREAAHEAAAYYERCDPEGVYAAVTLEHSALIEGLQGDLEYAALLEGFADARLRAHGFEREYTEEATHVRLQSLLAERFDAGDLAALLERGAATPAVLLRARALSSRS